MIQTLSILIALLLGYYLGLQRYQKDLKIASKRLGKAKAIITGMGKVGKTSSGIVYRPKAETIKRWHEEGKPVTEAFRETLNNIPEIQEAKRLLRKNEKSR
jgi:hypothetical protein